MNSKHLLEKNSGLQSHSSSLELLIVLFSSLFFLLAHSPIYGKSKDDLSLPSLSSLNKISIEEADQTHFNKRRKEDSRWFAPDPLNGESLKGVVLLTHGLNLRPSKMDQLAQFLRENHYIVLRLALPGHRENIQEQQRIKDRDWINTYLEAIEVCQKLKKKFHLPLYSLNYSLGSLVHLNSVLEINKMKTSNRRNPFKKSILLAPAAWSKWFTSWPHLLFFLPDSFGIKSFSHEDYRVEGTTSLAQYRALLKLQKKWSAELGANVSYLQSEPLHIIMHPKDELISLKKIEEFKREHQEISMKIKLLPELSPSISPSYNHLIIDKWAIGSKAWKILTEAILSALET